MYCNALSEVINPDPAEPRYALLLQTVQILYCHSVCEFEWNT